MDPIFTTLEFAGYSRELGNFGLHLALAMLVCGALASRAGGQAGLDVGSLIALCGFTGAGAIFGASMVFHIVEFFRTGTLEGAFASQGIVFYGAPMGGGLALYLASKYLEIPPLRFLDSAVHAVPIAHAVGRLGCFLGGCCFGRPYDGPFHVTYTHPLAPAAHPSVPRHAVPLYESALLLLLGAALMFIPPKRIGTGERVGIYFISYAVIRLVTESFRGDSLRGVWTGVFSGLSTSQLVSLVMLIIGVVFVIRGRRMSLKAPKAEPAKAKPA